MSHVQSVQQFETRREIKAGASYERVSDLAYCSAGAQARDVELVKKVSANPILRPFRPSKQLFVRKRYKFGANGQTSATGSRYLWSEYEILSKLRHPNIVRYVDFEYIPRKSNLTASIYMEYCMGGDLSQYTSNSGGAGKTISEKQFWEVFHQLASALLYCHAGLRVEGNNITVDAGWNKPILHRDIKPANVVISSTENGYIHVKICDFGLAKYQCSTFLGSLVGTRGYVAPEITDEVRDWSTKADIYSLGKTMRSLICSTVSETPKEIIEQCISTDLEKRPDSVILFEITGRNAQDMVSGVTLLHEAAQSGHLAVVNRLMEVGADPRAESDDGRTPLHQAALNGHLAVVNRLIEIGADPKAESNDGWIPLHQAALNGHLAVVNRLIEIGADPKAELKDGWISLHLAAENGHLAVINRLMEVGADPKAELKDGWTPLHLAAQNGHLVVVNRLIEVGADPKAELKDGQTSLYLAAQNGHLAVVNRLMEIGTDLKAESNDGRTPLHQAARKGHLAVVNRLMEVRTDPKAESNDGRTPLHQAALNGHLAVVNRLMEVGADPKAESKDGLTPLYLAAQNGHLVVVNRLIEVGADPNYRNKFGSTPFHCAVYHGRVEILHSFIRASGDPWLLDGFGRSVMDWASLYAPTFQAMGHLREHYEPTDDAVSMQQLKKTVQALLRSACDRYILFDDLGRCLLQAGDDSEATTAFEQGVEPSLEKTTVIHLVTCDMCGDNIQGPRYVCRLCADTDLCEPCFTKYRGCDGLRNCNGHTFLKIPSQAWGNLKPLQVNAAGETLEEWLERLKRQWNATISHSEAS